MSLSSATVSRGHLVCDLMMNSNILVLICILKCKGLCLELFSIYRENEIFLEVNSHVLQGVPETC